MKTYNLVYPLITNGLDFTVDTYTWMQRLKKLSILLTYVYILKIESSVKLLFSEVITIYVIKDMQASLFSCY